MSWPYVPSPTSRSMAHRGRYTSSRATASSAVSYALSSLPMFSRMAVTLRFLAGTDEPVPRKTTSKSLFAAALPRGGRGGGAAVHCPPLPSNSDPSPDPSASGPRPEPRNHSRFATRWDFVSGAQGRVRVWLLGRAYLGRMGLGVHAA